MIGRVLPRGQRVAGLVRYLYGPGKAEEHHDPRIVASWTGETSELEPAVTEAGHRDFRRLVALLEAPVAAEAEAARSPQPVYHLAVRAAAEDRLLTDNEWAELATEMMHHIGLSSPAAAEDGVRWIAVRHADDHIHIVATLARQDGRPARLSNDFHRVRETCRLFEQRYRLRSTAPADVTAARRPHRAEIEKARRSGHHLTARDRLRREVRLAAATAVDEQDFFARLESAGVMVKLRHSDINLEQVTGYAVSLPGVRAGDGTPVWYGGGKLAADLTLPRLRQRWAPPAGHRRPDAAGTSRGPQSTEHRRHTLDQAARDVDDATRRLRGVDRDDIDAAAATMYAAADTVTVAARVLEGRRGGPLTRVADRFDHAARERYGRVPPWTERVEHLRASARLLAAVRRIHPDDEALQAAELLARLAALADTVAMVRRLQRRTAQATAARTAAAELRAHVATYTRATPAPAPKTTRGFTPAPPPSRRPPARPAGRGAHPRYGGRT
ncbi:relaxase/mobilization nuclease domain-containing protein [Polymorphospora sp. NPDC050346]|uniref:relaxase/mobilization nuclease domain-containing protein n=1 Tax=Polymorphospora sp. NPDC050346 TaxID=3155780 RepID=UPI0033D4907D